MKKISIIIPAYNEASTLSILLEKVKHAPVKNLEKEIIVVDNNSKDDTFEIAKNTPGVTVYKETIKGKGAAVKCGFNNATGDILLIQDADLEYEPNDYQNVIQPILDGKTEITNGVRIEGRLRESNQISIGLFGWIGNHIITLTTNLLYGNNAREYEGCYKALTKRVYKTVEIKTNDFDFDNELLCKLMKKGHKPIDIPIHYYPRGYAEGKKINWRHGFKILWTIIKYRFVN